MATSALPGPDTIREATLSNGLRVLVYEKSTSASVVINGYVAGGAVHESAAQAGLSDLTAALMRRGTGSRTFAEINETIEAVGASFSIYSGRHGVGVDGRALAEDFELLVEVLGDVLVNPTFPPEHVERVRLQRLTGLHERDNDTGALASLLFRQAVYGEHPYGWPVDGWRSTLEPLTRDDVVSFYNRCIGPAGGIVAVAGAVTLEEVQDALEERLGGWQKQAAPAVHFPALLALRSVVRREQTLAGKLQADIVLGGAAVRRNDPDFEAVRLADTVLGRFGMMGRLGERVREQLGLAYYAYSTAIAAPEPGVWEVIAGVSPANVERCLEAVRAEIARLGSELAPEEELEDSKAFLTGSLPLQLETNEGIADAILTMARFNLGLDYLQRHASLVNAVTAEQVRAATASYLRPDAHVAAVVGPER